ncbi:hypothetical protein BLA23254_03315 [Burkholderia lata]|uniref:Uncharacterized protein n=1 Tax=Burkholderia lata (strain ATCC 17760 / DSM 23089 / LMG 22485 / NCIMB 9086 / R18194 / 383) TaxID=482957 RepID=A0A6P2LUY5_BURL3|nr:hypothetical protein BLA23254_03315 [Burkholderia lata]
MFRFIADCMLGAVSDSAVRECWASSVTVDHSRDSLSPPMYAQPWEAMGSTHYGTSPAWFDPSQGMLNNTGAFESSRWEPSQPTYDWHNHHNNGC